MTSRMDSLSDQLQKCAKPKDVRQFLEANDPDNRIPPNGVSRGSFIEEFENVESLKCEVHSRMKLDQCNPFDQIAAHIQEVKVATDRDKTELMARLTHYQRIVDTLPKHKQKEHLFCRPSSQQAQAAYEFLDGNQCNIIIIGDTKAGKSTILNVLLGEEILPVATTPCTSAICTIKYGEQKLLRYGSEEGQEQVIDITEDPARKIKEALHFNREHMNATGVWRPKYLSAIIEWPSELLKTGIVLIDTPGVSEDSKAVNDFNIQEIKKQIPKAAGVIFLVDSSAGRFTERFADVLRDFCPRSNIMGKEKNVSVDPSSALFIFSKWDVIERRPSKGDEPDPTESCLKAQVKRVWGAPPYTVMKFGNADNTLQALKASSILPPEARIQADEFKSYLIHMMKTTVERSFRQINAATHDAKKFIVGIYNASGFHDADFKYLDNRLAAAIEKAEVTHKEALEKMCSFLITYTNGLLAHLQSPPVKASITAAVLRSVRQTIQDGKQLEEGIRKLTEVEILKAMDIYIEGNCEAQQLEFQEKLGDLYRPLLRGFAEIESVISPETTSLPGEGNKVLLSVFKQTAMAIFGGPLLIAAVAVLAGVCIAAAALITALNVGFSPIITLGNWYLKREMRQQIRQSRESEEQRFNQFRQNPEEMVAARVQHLISTFCTTQNVNLQEVTEMFEENLSCKGPGRLSQMRKVISKKKDGPSTSEVKYTCFRAMECMDIGKLLLSLRVAFGEKEALLKSLLTRMQDDGLTLTEKASIGECYSNMRQLSAAMASFQCRTKIDILGEVAANDVDPPIENLGRSMLLGQGSFGSVYEVQYKGEPIAAKVITPSGEQELALVAFLQEHDTWSKLEHCNVVHYIGWKMILTEGNSSPTQIAIFMEKCDRSLKTEIHDRTAQLPSETVAQYLKEIVSGMAYIHGKDILHRDLKSDNILLKNGQAKIADFGLSKQGEANNQSVVGSNLYMAPEVFRKCYSYPADVFSFGLVAHEIVHTKLLPNDLILPSATILALREGRESIKDFNFSIRNNNWKANICKCLNFRPIDRPTFSQLFENF